MRLGERSLPINLAVVFSAMVLAACHNGSVASSDWFDREQAFAAGRDDSSVAVSGQVITSDGTPVEGALIRAGAVQTRSDANGHFDLDGLPLRNLLLHFQGQGFRDELIAFVPEAKTSTLEPVVLEPRRPGTVRMLFAGDTGFGRRFLDPGETAPRNALPPTGQQSVIEAENPLRGTRQALSAMRPYFQSADWAGLNFESPVTGNPRTPHPTKAYAFFTLPASLPALRWLGVDWVGLGNNHTFDYLEAGLRDTFAAFRSTGIPFSGAGLNQQQALQAYHVTLGGTPYAILAGTSITGDEHKQIYVANATKPGAMDLTDSAGFARQLTAEAAAGNVPIAVMHGGDEYTFEPTRFIRQRFHFAIDHGAAFVVAHHPHVLQGVEFYRGRPILHSLGNFAFDQDRLETMLSATALLDVHGSSVERIRLQPHYLDGFVPRPIGGRLAAQLLRRVGESSIPYGSVVYPYNGQGWVSLREGDSVAASRWVHLNVDVGESRSAIVDLRRFEAPEESLAAVRGPGQLKASLGRDLLMFGDFEQWDVVAEDSVRQVEGSRWGFYGSAGMVCHAMRSAGASAGCFGAGTRMVLKNRVRVWGDAIEKPDKDLTLFGYAAGVNSGPLEVQVTYEASEKEALFGNQLFRISGGGTRPWQPFEFNLEMPGDVVDGSAPEQNPRALRIAFLQGASRSTDASAFVDEAAVVSWDEPLPLARFGAIPTPHPKDFLRLAGPSGRYHLALRFERFLPATVARLKR
jgi:hypothetical protein